MSATYFSITEVMVTRYYCMCTWREKKEMWLCLSKGDKKKKPFFFFFFGFTGSSFLVATCGLSCPAACGILGPQPGIEAESLHWKADS